MTALKFKHLTGIGKTIEEAEEYRECKELLKSFSKYLPNPVRLSQWIEIDKEMADRSNEDLSAIFQRVVRFDFPWMLGLCPKPVIKPWEAISDDKLRTLVIWREFGRLLTHPENLQHQAVVLFRMNRLGVWAMHNLSMPKTGVFICVPAQQVANNNIIIEPIGKWAEREYR